MGKNTMQYDAKIIEQFALRLYEKARSIIIWSTIASGIVGYFIGVIIVKSELASYMLLAFGAANGFYFGTERAFQLKLQAQVALCQVQIEKNTRI